MRRFLIILVLALYFRKVLASYFPSFSETPQCFGARRTNCPCQVRGGGGSSVVVEDSLYADLPPTVFSPSGRLVAVEQILPIVNHPSDRSSSLVIAIHCHQGMAVVASLPKSPYLYDPPNATNVTVSPLWILDPDDDYIQYNDTRPPFCRLAPRLFGISAGNAADSQIVRHQLHELAQVFRQEEALTPKKAAPAGMTTVTATTTTMSINKCFAARRLARRWADIVHQRTLQESDARILACCALLVGEDEIWRVEPTGQFYRCRAAVVGRAATKAEQLLLDTLLKDHITNSTEGETDDDVNKAKTSGKSLSPSPPRNNHKQQQLINPLKELTIKEALALATKTILATLQVDSDDAAVRIRGLSLTTSGAVQWYSQQSLVLGIKE